MSASLSMCDHEAKTAVEVFALAEAGLDIEPILEYWADKDMNDHTTQCGSVAKK